jgi:hypothetical protein
MIVAPEFVTAVRWLYANGWRREDYGSLLHSSNEISVFWDWEKPGAEASLVAPQDATWVLEVSHLVGGKWRDDLVCRPSNVGHAIRLLVAEGVLPAELVGAQ